MKESTLFNDQNLTEKVHYVYRVIIDRKYYIGKHTGFLDDLHTGRYETSSKLIKEKLKNGKTFSKIKIIKVFSTDKEAYEFEEKFLTRVDARRNPKFLNQTNGNKELYCKQHTEETKKKISEKSQAQFNPNTEEGQRNKENHSKIMTEFYKTERGIKAKENHSKIMTEKFNPNTKEGRKRREDMSEIKKAQFDPNTEEGRKNLEENRRRKKEYFNPNTEEGRRNKENQSHKLTEFYKTERGIKKKEIQSEKMTEYFNPNTEEGRKRREYMSENKIEFYKTERGIKTKENRSETLIQKRINASILGELMFNEDFIKENFLIIDDKNNLRFLWSVYSKLTGYSGSHIKVHKRIGKLNFLSGINSIKLSEELENSKIKEIEAIIKSRNEDLSLKAS